jgi:AraC-like DNA-binding protein
LQYRAFNENHVPKTDAVMLKSGEKGTSVIDNTPNAPEPVRAAWLNQVARDLQCLAGEVVWDDVREWPASLVNAVDRLPVASTPIESLLLRGLLWESAVRIGSTLHRQAHRNLNIRCSLDEGQLLVDGFTGSGPDIRRGFAGWVSSFCQRLQHVHPPSKSRRVAAAIRRNFQQPLNMAGLARSVRMTTSGLRRAFRAEFGRTPRNYQAAVRLLSAIEQVGSTKIEGVALDVGYRSTKNFYRMFSSLTGLTPTEFRLLSDEDRRDVMASAWKDVQLGKAMVEVIR